MKNQEIFIGIDVSKLTLDLCILDQDRKSLVIKNTETQIVKFIKQLHVKYPNKDIHICIENTGKYSWKLMEIIPYYSYYFYVVNPLHLKRSLGLIRGKNDKIDAIRIAQFIKKNHQELDAYIMERACVTHLKVLMSERKYKVNKRKELKTKNKDIKEISNQKLVKHIIKGNNELIELLTSQIKEIENQIEQIIQSDTELTQTNDLLKSIPGIGSILSVYLIVKTNEFKSIKTARKLACFCGVAPFDNRSGTSIFGKSRVSILADKTLKRVLHMGALRAVRLDNDLKVYYDRKVKEGKNKMSVLNAVRNKIIHIVYALIKNQTFYQNRLVVS